MKKRARCVDSRREVCLYSNSAGLAQIGAFALFNALLKRPEWLRCPVALPMLWNTMRNWTCSKSASGPGES